MTKHLLADFGGTNARLALTDDEGRLDGDTIKVFKCDDHKHPADIFKAYLQGKAPDEISRVVLSVAGPVSSPAAFRFTNNPEWGAVDFEKMSGGLGLSVKMELINDFAAQSYATLLLGPQDYEVILPGDEPFYPSAWAKARMKAPPESVLAFVQSPGDARQRLAIIGPGTGLGVATAAVSGGQFQVIDGEGGHTRFPTRTRAGEIVPKNIVSGCMVLEKDVARDIAAKGNISISMETICSGTGLKTVFDAYCNLLNHTKPREIFTSQDITQLALADPAGLSDHVRRFQPAAKATTELFSRALGRMCSAVALMNKTQGGVVLTGGVLGKLGKAFNRESFAEEFRRNDLGANNFVPRIPVILVKHPEPGLVGAQAYAQFVPAQA